MGVLFETAVGFGATGAIVSEVQEWLCYHGHKILIDGVYGPATAAAVRDFQIHCHLQVNGQVNEETHRALLRPLVRATAAIDGIGYSFADLVVLHARQHLAEHPREIGGPNCGPWVRLYMHGQDGTADGVSQAWCAGFVSFILAAASRDSGWPVPLPLSASCTLLGQAAEQHQLLRREVSPGLLPEPGSLFLVRAGGQRWNHVGIITEAKPEYMRTIEGNSNDAGSHDGDKVCARIRGYDKKDFVVWTKAGLTAV